MKNKLMSKAKRKFKFKPAHVKHLAGDVAVSLFPSNSNDPGEIMTGNFPSISSYIANSLKEGNR